MNSLCSSLGFEELNEVSCTKVYPNPNTGELYLKLNQFSNKVYYSIINIHGNIVLSGVLDKVEIFLDLSKINSGIYIIKVENNSPIKIVKQETC